MATETKYPCFRTLLPLMHLRQLITLLSRLRAILWLGLERQQREQIIQCNCIQQMSCSNHITNSTPARSNNFRMYSSKIIIHHTNTSKFGMHNHGKPQGSPPCTALWQVMQNALPQHSQAQPQQHLAYLQCHMHRSPSNKSRPQAC